MPRPSVEPSLRKDKEGAGRFAGSECVAAISKSERACGRFALCGERKVFLAEVADKETLTGQRVALVFSNKLDFDPAGKTAHRNAHTCQTFSLRAVARLTAVTHAMETRRGIAGRRVCPVNMPLADMPPALIHIGSREVLMADAELMANRLVSAGVACTLKVWDRQVHVFQAAASWVPEARTAIDEIGAFVRARAAAEASPVPHRTSRTARTAAAVDRVVGG